MAMSNYLENALMNNVLKGTNYTPPSSLYIALYKTNPTDTDSGTEVTGGAYTRQTVVFGTVSNGTATNSADIQFPISTASWGTVTHIGIRDASTSGNLLFYGALSTSQTININNQLVIKSGQLSISLE